MRDFRVDNYGVGIAARDYGGTGQTVLLVHGLGGNVLDWAWIAPRLRHRYHVVALDLRCHGGSDDGEWTWKSGLSDVAAVAAAVGAENPAVVGHSMAGILAVLWGVDHPDCPGVVNLDGHGLARGDQFPGIAEQTVAEWWRDYREFAYADSAAMAGELSREQIDALRDQARDLAARFGVDEDLMLEELHRGLRTRAGTTHIRPDPTGTGRKMMEDTFGFDVFQLYPDVRCPVLIVCAGADLPQGMVPEKFMGFLSARRDGVLRNLEQLSKSVPMLRVTAVNAAHAMIIERPREVADAIALFLGGDGGDGGGAASQAVSPR